MMENSHEKTENGVRRELLDSAEQYHGGHCCPTIEKKWYLTGFCREFKAMMRLAWALVIVQTSQYAFNAVATMFGGHLGKLELDAIALSNTIINSFGNSIVVGFSACLDTTLSQSYGMGNYKMLGIYMQRGLILHLLILIPCYALFLNIKPILLVFGQDKEVVDLTEQYLTYFLPGLFFLFMWTALRKFTQCQNLVIPHIIIVLCGHLIHTLLQYLFLYVLKYGVLGSAVAQATTYFTMFVFTIIYTRSSESYRLCWHGWSLRGLLDWEPMAALAIHGMLMVCMEWWVFEASVFISGYLGPTELAAQSITFNLDDINFGVPSGIALATSIRVGQSLGAGRTLGAETSARMGMTLAAINSVIWGVLFIGLRYELPKLFTGDVDIIDLTAQLLPFVALYTIGQGLSVVGRGILRGTGLQKWGTLIILIAYYLIALPIALPLTFLTPLRIKGIWIGLTIALCTIAVIYFVAVNFLFNWEKLKDQALARAKGKANVTEKRDETTPLLSESGMQKCNDYTNEKVHISASLIVKRTAVVLIFLGILVMGIVLRFLEQDSAATSSVPDTLNTTMTTMLYDIPNTTVSIVSISSIQGKD